MPRAGRPDDAFKLLRCDDDEGLDRFVAAADALADFDRPNFPDAIKDDVELRANVALELAVAELDAKRWSGRTDDSRIPGVFGPRLR